VMEVVEEALVLVRRPMSQQLVDLVLIVILTKLDRVTEDLDLEELSIQQQQMRRR
jgi:hypothetical protein